MEFLQVSLINEIAQLLIANTPVRLGHWYSNNCYTFVLGYYLYCFHMYNLCHLRFRATFNSFTSARRRRRQVPFIDGSDAMSYLQKFASCAFLVASTQPNPDHSVIFPIRVVLGLPRLRMPSIFPSTDSCWSALCLMISPK